MQATTVFHHHYKIKREAIGKYQNAERKRERESDSKRVKKKQIGKNEK